MKTLTAKAYNAQQTRKWHEDWDKAVKERGYNNSLPQLAFYIFEKNYGYVAFEGNSACWRKTKAKAIESLESLNKK